MARRPQDLAVRLAETVMGRFETAPTDPTTRVTGLSEVFRHPLFTEATEADRREIMLASSQAVYDDEQENPWDRYFERDLTPLLADKDVLDLGCFTGGRAVAWAERYGLAEITGIDTERVFIEAAEAFAQRHGVRSSFSVARGEHLPFPDDAFDAIVSFDVFEHVQDPARVLEECRRVLKPAGFALIVFPGFFQPLEHHLSLVTAAPFLQYVFPPRVLLRAYCGIIEKRGSAAAWYARASPELRPWERGHTINGLTVARFRRLAVAAGFRIEAQGRKPVGSVGRRVAHRPALRTLSSVLRPLAALPVLEEALLHRAVFILVRP